MATTTKPSKSFWIITVLALIWNAMGVLVYLGQAFMTDDMKALIPADQLKLIENTPSWVTAAFAIAVWFGLLGCILLLVRKKTAHKVLIISLLGVLVQTAYSFFMTNALEVYGNTGLIQPIITILISFYLVFFAKKAENSGILA
ncbi:hypothetical protein KO506_10170 [Polaribacter vadi]|uniref:hypothetical protein n=1 Tax=Polaribacter TaxID=52959 RepID=UPI001C09AC66|nr:MULTISPECIES: hypothetical protein [Polaribacter]MBU3011769.1 hypothetical protein [Polaribacter vadi]MDO6741582.1 hypothetical protein [Polaribacter sp. 1_MG-2023]